MSDCSCAKSPVVTLTSEIGSVVWSASQRDGELYVLSPASAMEFATELVRFRATLTVDHATQGCSITAVYQDTQDAISWSEAKPLGLHLAGNGVRTSPWLVASDIGRGIRFGVVVKASAKAQSPALARVTMVIDLHLAR